LWGLTLLPSTNQRQEHLVWVARRRLLASKQEVWNHRVNVAIKEIIFGVFC
jgi:hypothetical protein